MNEIIVDNFAGGGGASTGIEMAIGRSVDIAINHDPAAIAMHKANHPTTKHYCESVWDVDPVEAAAGRPVGLAWFSPDCKHFSKAKGGKPRDKNIRGLAWVVIKWAIAASPRVIMLENVEEFKTWGPLDENGHPIEDRKGETFQAFIAVLSTGLKDKDHPAWKEIEESLGKYFDKEKLEKGLGYMVDWKELRACDYGAPTIRKRFFLIAKRDGGLIVWPKQTHGDPNSPAVKSGKLKPWKTAAEIIDWSMPCPSIFDRKKPLAENTMKRIARGIQKFVIENPRPFIIKVNHTGEDFRGQEINEPLQTVTAKNGWGIVSPTLIQTGYGEREGQEPRVPGLDKPLGTVVAGGIKHALVTPFVVGAGGPEYMAKPAPVDEPVRTIVTENHRALVSAFLAKHYGGNYDGPGADMIEPLPTVTTVDHNAVVTSHLIKMYGTNTGSSVTEPVPTVTAGGLHIGEVRAFLLKYYSTATGQPIEEPLHTVTTKDRIGLVTVEGQDYQIVDIGMRMLEPRELFAAQSFPDDYIIDRDADGKKYSKAAQVARCGNAVPPKLVKAIVRVNVPEMCINNKVA
ncbi:DNA (cytosine-5)-methyltransferase 1 [Hydrogenispora ethanolica]|uniref:DNA (cytosine-5-)-methyltransferase n=1 Tax=Hydrogenispora ethanolica TaxID=1082276 RepID=A0A4R1S4R9_HYDET|nr:DNA cytosine methyltransferase [Hydrogenispora ethanolica]TCL74211.1 DNA (cytosine-5)-methyltransferase 1 [Hydrogenispora ethanolica]